MKIPDEINNYTYILKCADSSLYTGWTNDLVKRLEVHNQGKGGKYTASRLPAELVYYEISASREEAMSREWHIKRLTRQAKEALIGMKLSGTFVYIADVSGLEDEEKFQSMLEMVSPERQEIIGKFRRDCDKRLSLGAAVLLEQALTEKGMNPSGLIYHKDEAGKPYIANTDNVYFNLSHSGERAMCVVSGYEAGCDVELMKDAPPKVADRFFSEKERVILHDAKDAEEYRDLFYRMWTLKESFIKCTGTGLTYPLEKFSVLPNCGKGKRQTGSGINLQSALKTNGLKAGRSGTECQREQKSLFLKQAGLIQNYDDRRYVLAEIGLDEMYRYSLCLVPGDDNAGPDHGDVVVKTVRF